MGGEPPLTVKQCHLAKLPRENEYKRMRGFGHLFLDDAFTCVCLGISPKDNVCEVAVCGLRPQ